MSAPDLIAPSILSANFARLGEDVERVLAAGAHAILVGEGLVRAPDVAAKVRELLRA